jgi:hypothetical protein
MDETPLLLLSEGRCIDASLCPNIASLAHDGVWFRNATVSDDAVGGPVIMSDAAGHSAMPTRPTTWGALRCWRGRTNSTSQSRSRDCAVPLRVRPDTLASRMTSVADDLRILYLHVLLTEDLRQRLPALTTDWARWA